VVEVVDTVLGWAGLEELREVLEDIGDGLRFETGEVGDLSGGERFAGTGEGAHDEPVALSPGFCMAADAARREIGPEDTFKTLGQRCGGVDGLDALFDAGEQHDNVEKVPGACVTDPADEVTVTDSLAMQTPREGRGEGEAGMNVARQVIEIGCACSVE
jgi:hypothetical protein